MSFMALYLPGYFLAFWSMDAHGLRWGLCVGGLLQAAGAWVRFIGVLGAHDNQAPHVSGYILCLVGQALAGLAQPMFTKYERQASPRPASVSCL